MPRSQLSEREEPTSESGMRHERGLGRSRLPLVAHGYGVTASLRVPRPSVQHDLCALRRHNHDSTLRRHRSALIRHRAGERRTPPGVRPSRFQRHGASVSGALSRAARPQVPPPIDGQFRRRFDALSVEHSRRFVKHPALSRPFPRRFSRSRIGTLRVSLRVTTF